MVDLENEYDIEELKFINANFLPGMRKKQWVRSRGSRIYQPYIDMQNPSFEVIREVYNYTFENGLREIKDYDRFMIYHRPDDTVLLVTDTTPDKNSDHIDDINKYCRNWQMNYLERAAKNLLNLSATLPEPYKSNFIEVSEAIEDLLDHYSDQVFKYRNRNYLSTELEDYINNETDTVILDLLSKWVKPPGTDPNFPNGLTTKQSILFQLTGVI